MSPKKITGGIYLVADPAPGIETVLPKIEKAIRGGLAAIQVWNHWQEGQDKVTFIDAVCRAATPAGIPVLVHEDRALLERSRADGIHFDTPPDDLAALCQAMSRPLLCGITCGSDLARVQWAIDNGIDYISFCSMFSSTSAGACTLVAKETVQQARRMTGMPIFLAGGISSENAGSLLDTGMDGIALISAIMKADDPEQAVRHFRRQLNMQINPS